MLLRPALLPLVCVGLSAVEEQVLGEKLSKRALGDRPVPSESPQAFQQQTKRPEKFSTDLCIKWSADSQSSGRFGIA